MMRTALDVVFIFGLLSAGQAIPTADNSVNLTVAVNLPHVEPKEENRATTDCGCGSAAAGRIVGGFETSAQNVPYQAKLSIPFGLIPGLCGGALLNKRYVITAMHCMPLSWQDRNIQVTLGYSGEGKDNRFQKVYGVEQVIRRSDYNDQTTDNDIALLRLSSDVQFNEGVQPVCLPTNANNQYVGQVATVSGFGTTSMNGGTSNVLKATYVDILSQSAPQCLSYGQLPNSQMCAYRSSTDSCQGDSGGPLVVTEDNRRTLVGIVSYGNGCAQPNYAGVYARVTKFLPWINENIKSGQCSTSGGTTGGSTGGTTGGTTGSTTLLNAFQSLINTFLGSFFG